MTIQKLAKQVHEALVTKTRSNGDKYLSFKDGLPKYMTDLAREAHNGILPDDHRYRFIDDALQAIVDHDDLGDACASLEADIYTYLLIAWLGSRGDRYTYVDSAIEEFGKADSLIKDLQMGQLMEKQETFKLVVQFLKKRLESEVA